MRIFADYERKYFTLKQDLLFLRTYALHSDIAHDSQRLKRIVNLLGHHTAIRQRIAKLDIANLLLEVALYKTTKANYRYFTLSPTVVLLKKYSVFSNLLNSLSKYTVV